MSDELGRQKHNFTEGVYRAVEWRVYPQSDSPGASEYLFVEGIYRGVR